MTAPADDSTPLPPLTLNGWLRWDIISRVLDDLAPISSVVEVGCGRGAMACRLAQDYDYVGYEPDPESAHVAAQRIAAIGTGLVNDVALPDDPDAHYDVLVAFEVLEHIEDDHAAMRSWVQWIRPGGAVLLSVPAHADQFGPWDRRAGHFRRYERDDLLAVFSAAGLVDSQVLSYGFPVGHALQAARNVVARRNETPDMADATAASGRLLQPGDRYGWATRLATSPFRLMQRPFVDKNLGTGFVAVARRPL